MQKTKTKEIKIMTEKQEPKVYKINVRMPELYGAFIKELAWTERHSINAEFLRIIEDEMKRRPDIMKALDSE